MDTGSGPAAAVAWPRLVPGSLLPPEDPSRAATAARTVRDWFVDTVLFLLAAGTGALFFFTTAPDLDDGQAGLIGVVDVVLGAIACLALWGRRRWPVGVAILTAVLATVSASAAPSSVAGFFGAAVHRRTTVALLVAGFNMVSAALFTVLRPGHSSFWFSMLISVVTAAIVTAWGMFVRARRQLVWTLRERAERAETEQRLMAERARRAERTRIAREMHDVLAHRISLLALHAGGLQMRPDLDPPQVAETAGLLRATAQQALDELRGVIGVLRDDGSTGDGNPAGDDTGDPAPPQPTFGDIPRLVEDVRRAGAKIDFDMAVAEGTDPPGSLGRDAYRIVQEALTNVAKHATGTATTVRVAGRPGEGLHVEIRNRLPVAAGASTLRGSGSGLLGLRERVALTGGTLRHGPTGTGEFVVDAALTWEE